MEREREKKVIIDKFPIYWARFSNCMNLQQFQEWNFKKFQVFFPWTHLGFTRPSWSPKNILPSYITVLNVQQILWVYPWGFNIPCKRSTVPHPCGWRFLPKIDWLILFQPPGYNKSCGCIPGGVNIPCRRSTRPHPCGRRFLPKID